MQQLLFATHNRNKASEIQKLLHDKYLIKTLDDIGITNDIAETGTTLMNRDHLGQLSYDVLGYRHYNDHRNDSIDEKGYVIGKYYLEFSTLDYIRVLRTPKSKKNLELVKKENKDNEIKMEAEIPDFIDDVFYWGSNPTEYEGYTMYDDLSVIVRIGDYDYYFYTTDTNDTTLPSIVESLQLDKSLKDEIVKI